MKNSYHNLNRINVARSKWFATLALSLTAAVWATCAAPVSAAAARPFTSVLVGPYPNVVEAGHQAHCPVTLAVRYGDQPWHGVPDKVLHVQAFRWGGVVRPEHPQKFFESTVRTDARGNAIVSFTMPPKLKQGGKEVGTAVDVHVWFAGDSSLPEALQNSKIEIKVYK
jgi:hypothetical protein